MIRMGVLKVGPKLKVKLVIGVRKSIKICMKKIIHHQNLK